MPGLTADALSAASQALATLGGASIGPLLALPRSLSHQDVQILYAVAAERAIPGSQSGISGEPAPDAPARDWHAWACRAITRSEEVAYCEHDPSHRRRWLIAAAVAVLGEIAALDCTAADLADHLADPRITSGEGA